MIYRSKQQIDLREISKVNSNVMKNKINKNENKIDSKYGIIKLNVY